MAGRHTPILHFTVKNNPYLTQLLGPLQEPEPDFALSGKLAAETNRVNGVVLLHVEPPEAAVPTQRWRLYQVSGGTSPLCVVAMTATRVATETRQRGQGDAWGPGGHEVPSDHGSSSQQAI